MSANGKPGLAADLDNYFRSLMAESMPATSEDGDTETDGKMPLTFRDRLDLFKAGVAYMAVKNKVDGDSEKDKSDEFGKLQRGYSRGAGRGRSGAAAANGASEQ